MSHRPCANSVLLHCHSASDSAVQITFWGEIVAENTPVWRPCVGCVLALLSDYVVLALLSGYVVLAACTVFVVFV